jgi:hypothetical protein
VTSGQSSGSDSGTTTTGAIVDNGLIESDNPSESSLTAATAALSASDETIVAETSTVTGPNLTWDVVDAAVLTEIAVIRLWRFMHFKVGTPYTSWSTSTAGSSWLVGLNESNWSIGPSRSHWLAEPSESHWFVEESTP